MKRHQLRLLFPSGHEPVEKQLPVNCRERCRELLAELLERIAKAKRTEGEANE
jgi:hypothetical protein